MSQKTLVTLHEARDPLAPPTSACGRLTGRVRGWWVVLGMWITSYLLTVFCLLPVGLLVFVLPARLYRRLMGAAAGLSMSLVSCYLQVVAGIQPVFHGDHHRLATDNYVVIANHRTRVDWAFMYMWVSTLGRPGMFRVTPKASLRSLLGTGWGMSLVGFLFFRRNWIEDREHVGDVLSYWSDQKVPVGVLLFPEATDYGPKNLALSNEYADERGLPRRKYVLFPRPRGFVYMVKNLRSHVDAVYDMTIAFSGRIPRSEFHLVAGHFPTEVHFFWRRHAIADMPSSDEELSEWVKERFGDKEQQLRAFYEGKDGDEKDGSERRPSIWSVQNVLLLLFTATVFPTLVYLMWSVSWVMWYFVLANVACWAFTKYGPWWLNVEMAALGNKGKGKGKGKDS